MGNEIWVISSRSQVVDIQIPSRGWFDLLNSAVLGGSQPPCPWSGVVISASSSDAPVKAVETLRRCGVVWGEPSCQALGCGGWEVKMVLFEIGVPNPRNPNHLVSGWLGYAITFSEYHSQKVIGSLGQNWSYVVWVINLQFGKYQ